MRSPSTDRARAAGHGQQGQPLPHRIAHAVHGAVDVCRSTQITAFQAGRDGRLYVATGNTGKVFEIGPGLEHEGSIESDVFDSGMYTLWGRLSFEAHLNGGQIAVTTRSGNLDQPQKNWSPWSAAMHVAEGRAGDFAGGALRAVESDVDGG